MRISIHDIEESPKDFLWDEPPDALNELFARGPVCDYTFPGPISIRVRYYRSGVELFFAGQVAGQAMGTCARCLEPYDFRLDVPYAFVLVPHSGNGDESEDEDVNLSYYRGHEVDLSPLIREQVVLALPMQPLCRDACAGLCRNCGANLNSGACSCPPSSPDPRLAVLRTYRARSPQ